MTPRTVFVSHTDHLDYDKWWSCDWEVAGRLVQRQKIPWDTRISTVMADRRVAKDLSKDSMSCEYILVEDQKRSIRFERECPNPIWWMDYTNPNTGMTHYTETPDVLIARTKWSETAEGRAITLTMRTEAHFPDYAIALWNVPMAYTTDRTRIETNAKDFLLVKNTGGECHLVLFFDLEPGGEIQVKLR